MKNVSKRTLLALSALLIVVIAAISFAAQKELAIIEDVDTKENLKPVVDSTNTNQKKLLVNEPLSHGQLLYENHCRTCHESLVHIRDASKAKTIADIQYWVGRWAIELEVKWSAEEIDAVVKYLNEKYYHY